MSALFSNIGSGIKRLFTPSFSAKRETAIMETSLEHKQEQNKTENRNLPLDMSGSISNIQNDRIVSPDNDGSMRRPYFHPENNYDKQNLTVSWDNNDTMWCLSRTAQRDVNFAAITM